MVGITSLDRNDREAINLLFVPPVLFHLNIHETEEVLQFWGKRFIDLENNESDESNTEFSPERGQRDCPLHRNAFTRTRFRLSAKPCVEARWEER